MHASVPPTLYQESLCFYPLSVPHPCIPCSDLFQHTLFCLTVFTRSLNLVTIGINSSLRACGCFPPASEQKLQPFPVCKAIQSAGCSLLFDLGSCFRSSHRDHLAAPRNDQASGSALTVPAGRNACPSEASD